MDKKREGVLQSREEEKINKVGETQQPKVGQICMVGERCNMTSQLVKTHEHHTCTQTKCVVMGSTCYCVVRLLLNRFISTITMSQYNVMWSNNYSVMYHKGVAELKFNFSDVSL